MQKSIFEQMGGTYVKVGDYYVPDLGQFDDEQGEIDDRPIGKYGMLRETYLKGHRNAWYNHLVLSGELPTHLRDIQEQAQNLLDALIPRYKERQGVTEALKVTDQMAWICRMNSIVAQIEEIIYKEIIYV